jgi:hypothetical protein
MKTIITIVFIWAFCGYSLFAQVTKPLEVQIRLENGKDKPWDNLIFAVAPNGTDTIDKEYNELEIPNWPFPAGVFTAVFMVYNEKEQQDIWSYKSVLGPSPDSLKFFKKFRFRVFYGNSSYVTMKWSKLPKFIDSAVISDPFDGLYFRVNMKDTLQKTNYEILVDEFEIYVHYNVDPNSIFVYELENTKINIYPNPAKDYIMLHSTESISKVIIYDNYGNCILSQNHINGDPIDISKYPNGVYLMQINNYEGNSFVKKLIINK